MKKTILISLFAGLLGISELSTAQINKGTIQVGANLRINNSSDELSFEMAIWDGKTVTKDAYISFLPSVGYFVANNISVGLALSVSSHNTKSTYTDDLGKSGESKTKALSYGVMPYARFYKMLNEQFGFFGQGLVAASFGTENTTSTGVFYTTTDTETSDYGIYLEPGIVFFPNPRIGIELSLGDIGFYTHTVKDNYHYRKNTTNDFGFSLDSSTLNVGIAYYFRK